MPTVPCPNPVNCEDAESPVSNLSAEGPDVAKCIRYSFTPQSETPCEFDLELCNSFAELGLDVGLLCDPGPFPPGGPNPPLPVIFSSAAQSCTVDCGDSTSETYTAVAGTFVALTQAGADALANAFACEVAALLCFGQVDIFTSAAQTCTALCADGTTFTYTTPAAFFSGLSQAQADAAAFAFACDVAALLCGGQPPIGLFAGAGTEQPDPAFPLYSNYAQSCSVVCGNGSVFTYTAEGGLYQRESREAANAVAESYACTQANARRFCVDDIDSDFCVNDFAFEAMTTSGSPGPITFAVVSGSLPAGLSLASNGYLQGIPTTPGSSTFTVRVTASSDGSYSERSFTIDVGEITPDTLVDGDVGSAYAEALTFDGAVGPTTWSITGGALPPGLTLNPNTGVIAGTPTTAGTFDFVVAASA